MACKQKPGQDLREHQLVFEAWYDAVEESWGSMNCPLHASMSEIKQATEAMRIKTLWFLDSLSLEHRKAVNELHNEFAITKSSTKYPKSIAKAVLWLTQYKSVNATLGVSKYRQFAQVEELSDDDNENEDEHDMDGEDTGVENAMHQMSFGDCAEYAFSGKM